MGYRKDFFKVHPLRKIEDSITHTILGERLEIHHLKPRCEGGSDNIKNLVAMTHGEHQVQHILNRLRKK